ncbi:MAG: T9SS type A sorting domain-containing protein [Bacteroidetes bacterium]|nr:T9SS type A sorting domain-containing protein [Bacteroidota bacterium]
MKKFLFLIGSFIIINVASGQISNGGFESYSSLPTCPSNYAITKATNWYGLKSSYPYSNCNSTTDVTSTLPDYFNSTAGGTSSCQVSTARTGTGYAHIEYRGFAPTSTASAEYIYQTVSVTSGRTYRITAYVNTLVAGWDPMNLFSITMVNTSVGSSASAILGNVRSQGTVLTSSTSVAGGFYRVEYDWTAPSTTTYYLVMGCNVFCNDGNYSDLRHFIIDDVSMNCAANAGSDKSFTCSCCSGGCVGVTIGTTASGSTYSWSPTTGLACSTCATTNAIPTSSFTTYTLTVSGSDCTTSTDDVLVTKYASFSCCPPKSMNSNSEEVMSKMTIYPNPSSDGKLIIDINQIEVSGEIEVFNISGKTVLKKAISSNNVVVDLSGEPKGAYRVKATINGEVTIKNVIVK